MERGSATWGDWCLDQLAHWSGAVSVDTSVRRLLELKYFVAAIHWCSLQDTTDIELHFDVLFIDKLQPALAWVDRLMPESRRDLLRLTESWLGALLQLIFGINLAILRSSAFWTPAAMRDAVLYCEFQGRAISPCLAPGNDLKAHDIHA